MEKVVLPPGARGRPFRLPGRQAPQRMTSAIVHERLSQAVSVTDPGLTGDA